MPATPHPPHSRPIRLIAVFKLFKAAMSIVVGFAALQFLRPHRWPFLRHVFDVLATHADLHAVRRLLAMFGAQSAQRIELAAAAAFLYAVLCTVEGLGLWWEKRWAEYVVVLATLSALPFEFAVLVHRPSLTRLAALLLNGVVAVYLVRTLRKPGTPARDDPAPAQGHSGTS